MKKSFYVIFFCLTSFFAYSQKGERIKGIYKTRNDFVNGKLSFVIDCNSKKNRIKLNDFFIQPYITIKKGDSTHRLLKKDIYGYQMCNNKVYRFNNKAELVSLNKNEPILI